MTPVSLICYNQNTKYAHFHVTVAEASGNLLVSTMMRAISRLIFRNAEMYLRTEDIKQIANRNGLAVYQAIADADPCLARAKMEQYLEEATSVMEAMRMSAPEAGASGKQGSFLEKEPVSGS